MRRLKYNYMSTQTEKQKEKQVSTINDQEKEALSILLQGIEASAKRGAFTLDESVVLKQSKDVLLPLIKKE